jgi:type IV pilus assembly protein PilN
MIRINLLAAERERSKRRAKLQAGQKLTLACSLILVATGVGIGWWYWSLTKNSTHLDEEIAAAKIETQRLRGVIQQVQQFDQRKAQLQQRVALIEQLRQGQTGPVHMLDQISRSLPDGLWLTELKQQGAEVTIDGRCTTLTALSDLVGNLSASGYFKNGVEILDSVVEPATPPASELIRFSVKAQFSMPGVS